MSFVKISKAGLISRTILTYIVPIPVSKFIIFYVNMCACIIHTIQMSKVTIDKTFLMSLGVCLYVHVQIVTWYVILFMTSNNLSRVVIKCSS